VTALSALLAASSAHGATVDAGADQSLTFGDAVTLTATVDYAGSAIDADDDNPATNDAVSSAWVIDGLVTHSFAATDAGVETITIESTDPLYSILFAPGMTFTASHSIGGYHWDVNSSEFVSFVPVVTDSLTIEFAPVPEPATPAMLGLGGLALLRRRRTRAA
jgi:hypothetical protein